jgi:hypothetical protein
MKVQTRPQSAFDIFKQDFNQSISNLPYKSRLNIVSPARIRQWMVKKIYQKKLE